MLLLKNPKSLAPLFSLITILSMANLPSCNAAWGPDQELKLINNTRYYIWLDRIQSSSDFSTLSNWSKSAIVKPGKDWKDTWRYSTLGFRNHTEATLYVSKNSDGSNPAKPIKITVQNNYQIHDLHPFLEEKPIKVKVTATHEIGRIGYFYYKNFTVDVSQPKEK